jgi:micrococcal nuclease
VLAVVAVAVLANDVADRGGRDDGPDAAADAGDSATADVIRVVDGDTIEVELEGRTESVRYIGVDTPETPKPGTPAQCFAEEASVFNEALVAGERVRLVFDRELRDRYGRLLAYVYVEGLLVNAELIRDGYARTLEIEPNTAMADRLSALERQAGRAGRGLWSSC